MTVVILLNSLFSHQHIREYEDISDEDEVRALLQKGGQDEGDRVIDKENGYEADIDLKKDYDWKKGRI